MRTVIDAHPGTVLTGSYRGRFTVHSGQEAAERLLADTRAVGRPLPDAIVCANDQMAIGVVRTLAARGIRIPEEVAVVGFDDIFPASLTDPPLTTVHQPMRKIGERGCDRLLERIMDPTLRPKVELLPAELVLRSSCGCPPGTVTRHHVATINRRKAGYAAKVPCPPSRGPATDGVSRPADPPLQPASPLARLANDEITER